MHKRISPHGDYDHMGEAINLIENFKVEKVIFNCGPYNDLEKEHTGQIMTYMNYIDKNIKSIDENKTVGIIICKQDNEYVIKYCSDDRIIAREYELVC